MGAMDWLTWWPMVYVYWRPDQWSCTAFMWTFRGCAQPQSITTCLTLGFLKYCWYLGSWCPYVLTNHSMWFWFCENLRNLKPGPWNKIILPSYWGGVHCVQLSLHPWYVAICHSLAIGHAFNVLQIFTYWYNIPKRISGAIFQLPIHASKQVSTIF